MSYKVINSFDIDGVILLGLNWIGVRPGPEDVIITGRCLEQTKYILDELRGAGITNQIFFNPKKLAMNTRVASAEHKVNVLQQLYLSGYWVSVHFEDDPVQVEILKRAKIDGRITPSIVHLDHDLTEK